MALTDQPYLPLYVNQWLSNKKLKFCTPAAHGIMINIMALMHKEDEYGVILLEQMFKRTDDQITNFALQIAKLTAFDSVEIVEPLAELLQKNVLRIDDEKLICNRMVNDASVSRIRASVGSEGGKTTQNNHKLAKAKVQANTVTVIVNENVDVNSLEEGGMGETDIPIVPPEKLKPVGMNDFIVPEMISIFMSHDPHYLENDKDHRSCKMIAVGIVNRLKLTGDPFDLKNKPPILEYWKKIISFITQDPFYCTFQISNIHSQLSTIISKMTKTQNGKSEPTKTNGSTVNHRDKGSNEILERGLAKLANLERRKGNVGT